MAIAPDPELAHQEVELDRDGESEPVRRDGWRASFAEQHEQANVYNKRRRAEDTEANGSEGLRHPQFVETPLPGEQGQRAERLEDGLSSALYEWTPRAKLAQVFRQLGPLGCSNALGGGGSLLLYPDV